VEEAKMGKVKLWTREDAIRIYKALGDAGVSAELAHEIQGAMIDLIQYQGAVRSMGRAIRQAHAVTEGYVTDVIDADE
jgi:hypothetical protein